MSKQPRTLLHRFLALLVLAMYVFCGVVHGDPAITQQGLYQEGINYYDLCNATSSDSGDATGSSSGNTIVLDPGHTTGVDEYVNNPNGNGAGDNEPVFDYSNQPEQDQVWQVALDVGDKLTAAGYNVLITKGSEDDTTTDLKKRAEFGYPYSEVAKMPENLNPVTQQKLTPVSTDNAALGVSIHTTPGSTSVGNDIFIPKVNEYIVKADGQTHDVFNNQSLQTTDEGYASTMMKALNSSTGLSFKSGGYNDLYPNGLIDNPRVSTDPQTGKTYKLTGTMLVTQYFATIPWLYLEQYQDSPTPSSTTFPNFPANDIAKDELSTKAMQGYEDGIIQGVENIVPLSGTPGANPSSCCTGSGPVPTPGSQAITVNNIAAEGVVDQAEKTSAAQGGAKTVGYALYDSTGKLLANNNSDTFENYGASITKSMLLVAYLRQLGNGTLSETAKTNLTGMIESSDNGGTEDPNGPAYWVYNQLTDSSGNVNAVDQLNTLAKTIGMTGFKADTSDPLYVLGQSKITAQDFALFFSKIDTLMPDTPTSAPQRSFGLDLLSHLDTDDQTGLLQSGLPGTVYSKEGWKQEPDNDPNGLWVVNQAGQFASNGTTYGVAVTVADASSRANAETIIQGLVSALVSTNIGTGGADSCCAGSVLSATTADKGSIYGLTYPSGVNQQQFASLIDQYIKNTEPKSPFVGLGNKFVEAGAQNNVNPAMMVAFAQKEQSLATASDWEDDHDHNSFGISGNNPGQQQQYPVVQGPNGPAVSYQSFEASLPEVADYIYAGFIAPNAPFHATTLQQLMNHYTPTGPGQSSVQQTHLVEQIEQKIFKTKTAATNASAPSCSDCGSASGDGAILACAQPYAGIYYEWGGGHDYLIKKGGITAFEHACPDPSNPPNNRATGGPVIDGGQSGNPSPCATDCSGLVSIAVDLAFQQNFNWDVASLQSDTKDWKKISINSIQGGDVVTIGSEHVEIVDHYDSTSKVLYTFGSHSTGTKTGEAQSSLSLWTGGAYRYIGPGA